MNGARGLLAAEDTDGGGKHGRDGGGHREARPYDQREENEDHEQVGEPLEDIVRPGVRLARRFEAQVVREYD